MLKTFDDLQGCPVRAQDGAGGWMDDLFFDDRDGRVSHVVLKMGRWPQSRRVLLASPSLRIDVNGKLRVEMTRAELSRAPHPDSQPPVSRQEQLISEREVRPAWMNPARIDQNGENQELEVTPFDAMLPNLDEQNGEPSASHRRSVREIIGYDVELENGDAGRVADVWLDIATWQVAHLSLDLPSTESRVAVPATLVRGISWAARTVCLSARWGGSSEQLMVTRVSPRAAFDPFRGATTR